MTGPLAMNICADSLDVGPPCPEPFPLRVMGAELRLPPSRLELLGDAFIPLEPVEVMAGREVPFSLIMITLTMGQGRVSRGRSRRRQTQVRAGVSEGVRENKSVRSPSASSAQLRPQSGLSPQAR